MPNNDLRHLHAIGRGRPARALRALAATAAALALLHPTRVLAQPVLGGGDDATVLRRGRARVRILGILESSSERYGSAGVREPLGAGASYDTLGLRFLPGLAPVRDTLRALVADQSLALSLGSLTTAVRVNTQTLPLSVEYGLFERVTLSVLVPIVRTQSSVNGVLDPLASGANIGFNPADTLTSATTAAGALARNRLFVRQVTGASTALRALQATCAVPNAADPRCATFTPAQATALLTEAAALQSRIGYVYGTGTFNSGVRFVPVAGSPLQRAVEGRVANLSQRFRSFGVDSLAATTTPLGAQSRLGLGGLQSILSRGEFPFAGDSLRGRRLSGTGDVELAATMQWLDTFHGDERARLAPTGLHLRSSVTAGYRLGTGSGEFPGIWFAVPTGSGASALLLRSATDIVLRTTAVRHGRRPRSRSRSRGPRSCACPASRASCSSPRSARRRSIARAAASCSSTSRRVGRSPTTSRCGAAISFATSRPTRRAAASRSRTSPDSPR